MELKLGQRIGRAVLLEGLTCHLPFGVAHLALEASAEGPQLRVVNTAKYRRDDVEVGDLIRTRRHIEQRADVLQTLGTLPLLDVTVVGDLVYSLEPYAGQLAVDDVAYLSKRAGGSLPWAAMFALVQPYVEQCRLSERLLGSFDNPLSNARSIGLSVGFDGGVWFQQPTLGQVRPMHPTSMGREHLCTFAVDEFYWGPQTWMWHLGRRLVSLAMGKSLGLAFSLGIDRHTEALASVAPPAVTAFLRTCLARPREGRFATWDALVRDLDELIKDEGRLSPDELGSLMRQLAPDKAAFEDELFDQLALLPVDFVDDQAAYVGEPHRGWKTR